MDIFLPSMVIIVGDSICPPVLNTIISVFSVLILNLCWVHHFPTSVNLLIQHITVQDQDGQNNNISILNYLCNFLITYVKELGKTIRSPIKLLSENKRSLLKSDNIVR